MMDKQTSSIRDKAWESLFKLFADILARILYPGTTDQYSETTESEYYLNKDIQKFIKKLENGEAIRNLGYPHELIEPLVAIARYMAHKNEPLVREGFEDLFILSEELNIDLQIHYEIALSYLDILEIRESELLYITKEPSIYIPQLIVEANDELIKRLAKSPGLLYSISPRKFEEIIAEIFYKRGYKVELTKATRDGGRDIVAFYEHMNVRTKYIVECKRYSQTNKISIGIVQRLFGVKIAESANKAILATTSTFTKDAKAFANNHIWDLDLKDYNDIVTWVKSYR